MGRTALTKTTALGAYNHAGVVLTMTAADTGNSNMFVATGKDLLIVRNTDASDHTFTVTSTPDAIGRTKDITTETVAAGTFRIVGPLEVTGWIQTDGNIYLAANSATVKFGIVAL